MTGLVPFGWNDEVAAQSATVRTEENLRAEPNGAVVGRLSPGTQVVAGETQGSWRQVTVEGFLWAQSLQVRTFGSFDLVVSAPDGENLRRSPSGDIVGRLSSGTLLEEVERIPGWIRVRRTAWIWGPSLTIAAAPAPAATPSPAPTAPPAASPAPAPSSMAGSAVPPSPPSGAGTPTALDAASVGGAPQGWVRSGADGTRILVSPDGDALGRVEPGSDLRVMAREGNWARVQVEGWVWMPVLGPAAGGETLGDPTVLAGVRIRDLVTDFERYRGRLIEVDLQFISMERAEQVRTDFYEGEPFLLTRSVEQERSFVYVAIPAGRMAEVQSLAPLERIRIVGRVRSGAAAFTGSPILDLMEMTRLR